jgi:hypothetical protein
MLRTPIDTAITIVVTQIEVIAGRDQLATPPADDHSGFNQYSVRLAQCIMLSAVTTFRVGAGGFPMPAPAGFTPTAGIFRQ